MDFTILVIPYMVGRGENVSLAGSDTKRFRVLMERLRALFYDYRLESMRELFEALFYGYETHRPILITDSS